MAGIAQAAGGAGELVQSTGKVLLSTGHGFAPVAVHQPIGIGSRILVADAASAFSTISAPDINSPFVVPAILSSLSQCVSRSKFPNKKGPLWEPVYRAAPKLRQG